MGASRKLQGEIDRVLKKVQEGVDVFDSIWNKVYDTDNANQKEKFEADLKKEIKKLQRYRDQIKTWIQSSEIKDKKVSASYEQALVDARKQIEREMERFKICEKETKTKAFSKEGLGQQPKTDPKEKAKSETRDWLNNVVSDLESQIDTFEAEIEGLVVKKGKTRPPRLTHLETSISRHKAHIMKLELILRLLDNDELSPDHVNDVKDFLDDYVERNQEDFEEFDDVDELYSSLPLDKVEALEDLIAIGGPSLGKGGPVHSLKTSLATATSQLPANVSSTHQHNTSAQEQADDTVLQDSNSGSVARTPTKSSIVAPSGNLAISPSASTPSNTPATVSGASAILPGSASIRGPENATAAIPSAPSSLPTTVKEEEVAGFPGRTSSPLAEAALTRGIARGGLPIQSSSSIPLSSVAVSGNGAHGAVPTVSDVARRNILGSEVGSSTNVQPLTSPLASRMILPQASKANEGASMFDSGNGGEPPAIGGRAFSPSLVTGMQWRPGSSFQNQSEAGQFRARTEIAPDQREKFLQRFQQVQQQGHSNLLGMPSLAGGNHKQFSAQQNPLLQQFNTQSASVSHQASLGLGGQASSLSTVPSAGLQQPNTMHQISAQQATVPSIIKDADVAHPKSEEQQQPLNLPEDVNLESAPSGHGRNLVNEDELKTPFLLDSATGASASMSESVQAARDIDLSAGQPLQFNQPPVGLGVIGRRNVPDLGTIGDSVSASSVNTGSMHDHLYNLQMLEAAFHKLPQPKDSERPMNYVPRNPTQTPASYPQVQAPIVNNPVFWDRLSIDNYGTDTLFFAFYYQQNTYQQYLAARALKKQSWRYHKKYTTWFQRHEEPKVATDDYEQGRYVYFDYHLGDDMQHGWCQRIRTDFTFEYNHLEDELNV